MSLQSPPKWLKMYKVTNKFWPKGGLLFLCLFYKRTTFGIFKDTLVLEESIHQSLFNIIYLKPAEPLLQKTSICVSSLCNIIRLPL